MAQELNRQIDNFQHNTSMLSVTDMPEEDIITPTIVTSPHVNNVEGSLCQTPIERRKKFSDKNKDVMYNKSLSKGSNHAQIEGPKSDNISQKYEIVNATAYRAEFGFGSVGQNRSRSGSGDSQGSFYVNPLQTEINVVATLVPEDADDQNPDRMIMKAVLLLKGLVGFCVILTCIAIGAGVYLYNTSSNEFDSTPSITKTSNPTDSPTNSLSMQPSPSYDLVTTDSPTNVKSVTPSSSHLSASSYRPTFQKDIKINDWAFYPDADISIGPGSYYRHDPNITITNSEIATEIEAIRYVESLNVISPENPIIMWMLSRHGFLAHRLLFLSQNLDASPKNAPGFIKDTADFLAVRGIEGVNVYYQKNVFWRVKEHGSIGEGVGASSMKDSSISISMKNITSERDGHLFTELFNIEHTINPIIVWEVSRKTGNFQAHRLKYLSQPDVAMNFMNIEEYVDATVKFMRGSGEKDKSNNVFYLNVI